jgi:peptidoglycan/xylan/chitin deacetylase (PgdA/CDA1 family)
LRKTFNFRVRPILALVAVLTVAGSSLILSGRAWASQDAGNAVIIMYHRFGEEGRASTNIRLEQFEAHLAELNSGQYNVLPLPEIVQSLRERRPLPPRSVAIAIDDAFASVYREAWPRLRQANLPFTLFVATEALDQELPGYLSWDQLREMHAAGGMTIGNHSHDHGHMAQLSIDQNKANIETAADRFRAELGFQPSLFAYPYGELGASLRDLVQDQGFEAAFGQHSGSVGPEADLFSLPRFPLNEDYGDMDRFRLVVNSLPLPVTEVLPSDPLLQGPQSNPPAFGFTLSEQAEQAGDLNCFAGNNEITLEHLGGGRIEVRFARPFDRGRARVNCTLRGRGGRWHWFGAQFYVAS